MDDLESLRKIRTGGSARSEGVSELYRRYASRMLAYFMRNRVPQAEAEDLIQDVFVSVVRNCGQFRGDARIDAWLWSIARNRLIDRARAARPTESIDDEELLQLSDGNVLADPASDVRDLVDCVRRGFARFAREHHDRAQALILSVAEGWSVAELAAFLGRTPGATREYISQCRKRLREFLEDCRPFLAGG
jgi:RNA polymerase sigma-70 factor (ECF subfamily)